jgi:hypothetical protein
MTKMGTDWPVNAVSQAQLPHCLGIKSSVTSFGPPGRDLHASETTRELDDKRETHADEDEIEKDTCA